MQKKLTYIALFLSVAAVLIALAGAWNAGRAVEKREEALIEHYRPILFEMYKGLKVKMPQDPKTIEDLFDPMLALLNSIQ